MLAQGVARLRSLWRGMRGRDALEHAMDEEFATHLALRADDLVRQGMPRAEAERTARLEFGMTEAVKHRAREARGLLGLDRTLVTWLDFKLGFRMLVRYPALTLVAGVAIAFGIAAGLTTFSFVGQALYPRLPLPEGDRLVGARLWNAATSRVEPLPVGDVQELRRAVRLLHDVGAFRTTEQNLRTRGAAFGEPVTVAEMSASGFRVARVAPLLGRALGEGDEAPGAPRVAVLSFETWRSRLGSDSSAIGTTVQLGREGHVVVGVMPPGFAFPVAHEAWVPLRTWAHATDAAVIHRVFGRLPPGRTLDEAAAELGGVWSRLAAARGDTATRQSLQLLPYARSILDVSALESRVMLSVNLLAVLFLLVVSGNVAMLMFARTSAREGELVVRRALGASTGRIVVQLMAESLVLAGVASVIGVVASRRLLQGLFASISASEGPMPFWVTATPTPAALWYALGLTAVVAVVTGAVPALKVLRGMATQLRAHSSGGGGGRFGGMWTAAIVMQVMVTVTFPASTFFVLREAARMEGLEVGFNDREYLSARLDIERDPLGGESAEAFQRRAAAATDALSRELENDGRVAAVALTTALPHASHALRQVEVEGGAAVPPDSVQGHQVSIAHVSPSFFATVGAAVQGRSFHLTDTAATSAAAFDAAAATPVIVNESFVRLVLGGRQAIGRRVRYVEVDARSPDASAPQWHEIVGVVKDLAMTDGGEMSVTGAGIYHPMAVGAQWPAYLLLRARGGEPSALAQVVRAAAAEADATLRVSAVIPLRDIGEADRRGMLLWAGMLAVASALTLLLSLAGIYAVMAFTVARRTREIGIRVALGSDPRRVALAMLARPVAQVGGGVAAGGVLVTLLAVAALGAPTLLEGALLVGYALLMLGVCLLAGVVPARRALRVQPMEALRVDL